MSKKILEIFKKFSVLSVGICTASTRCVGKIGTAQFIIKVAEDCRPAAYLKLNCFVENFTEICTISVDFLETRGTPAYSE